MAEITGIIQRIDTKDVAGGKKAYNIVVGGESYGAGLYAPKCKEGDYVKFELDNSRGYLNVGRNSLKVSTNKPPAEAVSAAAVTMQKAVSGIDNRQDIISRQAASNTAIEFMKLLASQDALGLPAANTKGKKQEAIELLYQEYMKTFYENNTGQAFKDIAPQPEKAVAAAEVEEDAPADSEWK